MDKIWLHERIITQKSFKSHCASHLIPEIIWQHADSRLASFFSSSSSHAERVSRNGRAILSIKQFWALQGKTFSLLLQWLSNSFPHRSEFHCGSFEPTVKIQFPKLLDGPRFKIEVKRIGFVGNYFIPGIMHLSRGLFFCEISAIKPLVGRTVYSHFERLFVD